jgi:hypothetical protein
VDGSADTTTVILHQQQLDVANLVNNTRGLDGGKPSDHQLSGEEQHNTTMA